MPPRTYNRREYLKSAGAAGGCTSPAGCCRCPADRCGVSVAPDHFIPVDKKLDPRWIASLTAKGQRTSTKATNWIRSGCPWEASAAANSTWRAMAGCCTGISSTTSSTAASGRPITGRAASRYAPLAQGFALQVASRREATVRTLDRARLPQRAFLRRIPDRHRRVPGPGPARRRDP